MHCGLHARRVFDDCTFVNIASWVRTHRLVPGLCNKVQASRNTRRSFSKTIRNKVITRTHKTRCSALKRYIDHTSTPNCGALLTIYLIALFAVPYACFVFCGNGFNPLTKPANPSKRTRWRQGRIMALASLIGWHCSINGSDNG